MEPGDVVEVEVAGLGQLANTVAAGSAPRREVGDQPSSGDDVTRVALGGDWLAKRDTEAGRAATVQPWRSQHRLERELLAPLSDDERATRAGMLAKVQAH
jgi:hypothetical protein